MSIHKPTTDAGAANAPSSVSRAFDNLMAMGDDLDRLNGVLQLFFMLDMKEVVPEEDDAAAIISMVKVGRQALLSLKGKRYLACGELRDLVFPNEDVPS